MKALLTAPAAASLPDHMQLPHREPHVPAGQADGAQNILLTEPLGPHLAELCPDGRYMIGHDTFIYHTPPVPNRPPTEGAKAPDWFFVTGVPAKLAGEFRRSYVLWHEIARPPIVMEWISDNGREAHDRTVPSGKFHVYERLIRVQQYVIWNHREVTLEVYRRSRARLVRQRPNAAGRYEVPALQLELGIWKGWFQNAEGDWLRWWYPDGRLLLTGAERALEERAQRLQAEHRAEREHQQAELVRRQARQARRQAARRVEREQQEAELARRQVERERQQREDAVRQAEEASRQVERERQQKEDAVRQAEEARRVIERDQRIKNEMAQEQRRLAEKLRALGIDPDRP